jgi:hypothetical protein
MNIVHSAIRVLPSMAALATAALVVFGPTGVLASDNGFQRDCPPAFDFGPVLMDAADADAPIPIEVLRCETFLRAQWTFLSDGADALQAMSARTALGSDALGVAEAERRRLSELISGKRLRREQLLALPADQREPDLGRISAEITRLTREVAELNDAIDREFPAYGALSAPSALTVDEVRSLLRPDEVVVQILVNEDAAYIWAVSQDRIEWRRAAALGSERMTSAVMELRASLQAPDVSRRDGDALAPEPSPDEQLEGPGAFNRLLAHALYEDLLGQVEGTIADATTLIVVANGALSALPLGVLVTETPIGDDRNPEDLRATSWLADRHVLVSLPSLSALRSLRCFQRGSDLTRRPAACPPLTEAGAASLDPADSEPLAFFGVGNPVLGFGATPVDRSSALPPPVSAAFSGRLANVDLLRRLAPLPGTGRELSSIAAQFADRNQPAVILTGNDAREPNILGRDDQGGGRFRTNPDLARARFVSFATHGLLTGQGGEHAEPGLVLTPPGTASEADDGLLAASEAAQLSLRAEFVVLSACNTAAADGAGVSVGAEGLAGLGPAFFYAGARSLLVSHWAVDDNATAALMTATFAFLDDETHGQIDGRQGRGQGRAAAFQRATREVRNNPANPAWAHPGFWAAFSFVGDPG